MEGWVWDDPGSRSACRVERTEREGEVGKGEREGCGVKLEELQGREVEGP